MVVIDARTFRLLVMTLEALRRLDLVLRLGLRKCDEAAAPGFVANESVVAFEGSGSSSSSRWSRRGSRSRAVFVGWERWNAVQ